MSKWNRDSIAGILELLPLPVALRLRRTCVVARDAVEMNLAVAQLELAAERLVEEHREVSSRTNQAARPPDVHDMRPSRFLEAVLTSTTDEASALIALRAPDVAQRCVADATPIGKCTFRAEDAATLHPKHDIVVVLLYRGSFQGFGAVLAKHFERHVSHIEVLVTACDAFGDVYALTFVIKGTAAPAPDPQAPLLTLRSKRLGTVEVELDCADNRRFQPLQVAVDLGTSARPTMFVPPFEPRSPPHLPTVLLAAGNAMVPFWTVREPTQLPTPSPWCTAPLDATAFLVHDGTQLTSSTRLSFAKKNGTRQWSRAQAQGFCCLHQPPPSAPADRWPRRVQRLVISTWNSAWYPATVSELEESPVPEILLRPSVLTCKVPRLCLPAGLEVAQTGMPWELEDSDRLIEVDLTRCERLRSVGSHFFSRRPRLSAITFGRINRLRRVPSYFLSHCPMLSRIDLGPVEGLQHIGDYAFAGNGSLTSLTLPTSLCSLGQCALEECGALRTLDLSRCTELVSIGSGFCRRALQLQACVLPSGLRHLGDRCFEGCEYLQSIDLVRTSLVELPNRAFRDCRRLESLVLPCTVETIRNYAGQKCGALATIDCTQCVALHLDPRALVSLRHCLVRLPVGATGVSKLVFNKPWHGVLVCADPGDSEEQLLVACPIYPAS